VRGKNSSVSLPIPSGNQGRRGGGKKKKEEKKQSLATGGACSSKSAFEWRFMQTPDWK